ncbi:MAG: glycine cleavage system aminomethyltransferase GcvT [Halobacteriaceae archaeon]
MPLRTPPLRDAHEAAGAKFTEFGGWDMPVEFDSIQTEHAAVRESVGRFDVSHMGEIEVTGPDAERLCQRLTSNDVTALDPGEAQYAMITDDDGIILDDTVVYNLPAERAADYLFVPNAGHDDAMHDRWVTFRDEWGFDAAVANRTEEYALFAVQGPDAMDLVTETSSDPVADLGRFDCMDATVADTDCLISRTGYTGEDGVEIMCEADAASDVWTALDCQRCGLGARDTLRIEMGYLLSGQDFDPETEPHTPYEAGVGFTVKLDTEFVGRDALERQDAEGTGESFVGVRLLDRGVPRNGYEIVDGDNHIVGTITSGTMSPTLDQPIGLGYVPTDLAEPGTHVGVTIRGERKRGKVVTPPFLEGY